jgi:2-polyprenyl-3-methyl-5-hydroxy-6-metoxy-1,4-benzoquinol methylase
LGSILPSFDLITLWDVLEHFREPLEMLNELVRQLSPSGLLFASTPSALPMVIKSRIYHDLGLKFRFSWNPREHVSYYSPKTLRLLCKEAGLEVLRMGAVSVYPRRLSAFEVFRRVGFLLSKPFTKISPQIYVLAMPKNAS